MSLYQITSKKHIHKGPDERKIFESYYHIVDGNNSFELRPSDFKYIHELGNNLEDHVIVTLMQNIEASKNMFGYSSSDGKSLYYNIFKIGGEAYLLIISFGEVQPMLFALDLEGIWRF